jgi:hypothetical protein
MKATGLGTTQKTYFPLKDPSYKSCCEHYIMQRVLYGCGTWSVTLREEHRLRVFENRVSEEDIWS